jgi:hypothetical protein
MQVHSKALAALFFILLMAPAAAHAQTTADPAWTAGGIVGFGRTWDDESQIGSGVLLGARVDGRSLGASGSKGRSTGCATIATRVRSRPRVTPRSSAPR